MIGGHPLSALPRTLTVAVPKWVTACSFKPPCQPVQLPRVQIWGSDAENFSRSQRQPVMRSLRHPPGCGSELAPGPDTNKSRSTQHKQLTSNTDLLEKCPVPRTQEAGPSSRPVEQGSPVRACWGYQQPCTGILHWSWAPHRLPTCSSQLSSMRRGSSC